MRNVIYYSNKLYMFSLNVSFRNEITFEHFGKVFVFTICRLVLILQEDRSTIFSP